MGLGLGLGLVLGFGRGVRACLGFHTTGEMAAAMPPGHWRACHTWEDGYYIRQVLLWMAGATVYGRCYYAGHVLLCMAGATMEGRRTSSNLAPRQGSPTVT